MKFLKVRLSLTQCEDLSQLNSISIDLFALNAYDKLNGTFANAVFKGMIRLMI